MSTAVVHRSPNKLWRFKSIFNLCVDDSSLNYASWTFETEWPYLCWDKLWGTVDAKQLCIRYTYKLCQASLADFSRKVPCCVLDQDTSVRDASSKGQVVQGTSRPRDTSIEGRLVQGTIRPRDATFETFRSGTLRSGTKQHCTKIAPSPELLVKKSKGSTAIFDRNSEHLPNRKSIIIYKNGTRVPSQKKRTLASTRWTKQGVGGKLVTVFPWPLSLTMTNSSKSCGKGAIMQHMAQVQVARRQCLLRFCLFYILIWWLWH